MIEALGLIIGVVGVALAFETPRQWLANKFRKLPDIEHEFKVRTVFHVHNDGQALEESGKNKTQKIYQWVWTVKNNTSYPIQIEQGIYMSQASENLPPILLKIPEFTEETTLQPKHFHLILKLELTPQEINHYRHWVRECSTFGLRSTSGANYWVTGETFIKFKTELQNIALALGLSESVPRGKKIVMKLGQEI